MSDFLLACYDLRSYFTFSPELRQCPQCRATLLSSPLPPSQNALNLASCASIPLIETRLLRCPDCDWWAVRETVLDAELNDGCADLLITESLSRNTTIPPARRENTLPIRAILSKADLWQAIQPLSSEEARLLLT